MEDWKKQDPETDRLIDEMINNPVHHRIFIAGPYCPYGATPHDASRLAQRNVDKAIEVANELIRRGHYIFVPHVSHYIHTHHSNDSDKGAWWYDEDNTFLDYWATALYFIGSSNGADAELKRAEAMGLTIFKSMDEVPIEPWTDMNND